MSEPIDPQGGEIEVSPEEERFLKRFFRRQLRPYALVFAALVLGAVWWSGDDDAEAREARVAAAVAQLRTENQRLARDLASVSERLGSASKAGSAGDELEQRVEDAKRNVRMIEARVTATLERRLDVLESRLAQGEGIHATPGSVASPPPDASAWDVSAILDRLYALEMNDQGGRADPALAARLTRLEERLLRLEQTASIAATPAPPLEP